MDDKLVTLIKQSDYSKQPQKHTEKTQLQQMNSFFLHQMKFRLALFKETFRISVSPSLVLFNKETRSTQNEKQCR